VRRQGEGDRGAMKLEEFAELIRNEVQKQQIELLI